MWGSPSDGTVPLEPFQFHVHSTCEHAVDGFLCPLELHLVTRVDQKAKDIPEQCKTANCLAVFGVIYTFDAEKLNAAMVKAQSGDDDKESENKAGAGANSEEHILDLIARNLPKGPGPDVS